MYSGLRSRDGSGYARFGLRAAKSIYTLRFRRETEPELEASLLRSRLESRIYATPTIFSSNGQSHIYGRTFVGGIFCVSGIIGGAWREATGGREERAAEFAVSAF